jgi:hypothetical protein
MKVICIRHPKYSGKESPVLSCKTCCGIFIAEIKARSTDGEIFQPAEWLDKKAKEAAEYNRKK